MRHLFRVWTPQAMFYGGINDVEEDEAAEDISELPKSLDWISLKKVMRATAMSLKKLLSIPTARILH